MLDIITLKGLTASGTHGVYDFEQREQQPFVVDVSMWVDISQACSNDDIDLTVSYADIAQDVSEIIEGPSVRLIETLANSIAARVLARPRVRGVEVTVHKPHAPISRAFQDVCVRVRRGEFDSDGATLAEVLNVPEPSSAGEESQPVVGHLSDVEVAPVPSAMATSAEYEFVPSTLPEAPSDLLGAQPEDDSISSPMIPDSLTAPQATVDTAHIEPALVPPLLGDTPAFFPSRRSLSQAAQQQDSSAEDETAFVLAFGGNQGNVPVTLVKALERLIDTPGMQITAVSPLLRTRAVLKPGMDPQPDHWNAVVLGQTKFAPYDLLDLCASIESDLGRERPFEWAPRTIDIDIIAMGEHIVDEADLQLPHPRAFGRAFVLIPWFLADAEATLPGYGAVADLIPLAPDRDGVIDAVEDWYENPETLLEDSDAILHSEEPASVEPPAEQILADLPAWSSPLSAPTLSSALEQHTNTDLSLEQIGSEVLTRRADRGPALETPEEPVLTAVPKPTVPAADFTDIPSFSEALAEEKTFPVKSRIPWKPVTESAFPTAPEPNGAAAAPDSAPQASFSPLNVESLVSQDNETEQEEPVRPLPNWNFSRAAVTIIDSTGDDQQDVVHSLAPKEQPQSRTILDPELPEGTPVGTAPSFPTTASMNVQGRRNTMRPTHTGMIPVVKRTPPSA